MSGERANLVDRIRGQINDKRSYATLRLGQLMCGEEAFGVDKLGDVEHAAAVTPGSLWERYQQLLSTAQIELYYCGSAEEERVARALKEALSALPVNEGRICPDCEVRLHAGPEPSMVEESMDVTQGKLAMGFRTGGVTCWEEEYPAMAMCNAVFGGTTLSKLFMNVREKQSLCYYCAASYTSLTGALCVDSGVEHANAAAARESILKELAALCAGPVEDGELADTKRALKNQLAAVGDTLQGLEGWYFAERMRGADKAPEQVAAEVDAVTADDVRRVLSSFRLSVCYTLTKEAGADA